MNLVKQKSQITYDSRSSLSISSLLDSLLESKELTWRFFLKDLKAQYMQSFIGWLWIFAYPVSIVITFTILSSSGVIHVGVLNIPYPIYAFTGITIWQVFANGLNLAANSITNAGTFVVKINFSKISLVISSIAQVIPEFFIKTLMIVILYIIYGKMPPITILLLPLLIIPLIILTLGLGLIAALLNTVTRDIQNIISLVINLLLFFIPIMYTAPSISIIAKINTFNPLYYLVIVPRNIILYGSSQDLNGYLLSVIVAIFFFFLGLTVFLKSQSKITESI